MTKDRCSIKRLKIRCAIYTRKSTEEGLDQDFNSLDAQRESGEAFIKSQAHDGWVCLADSFDDGGFTGGNMDRPALRELMAKIEAGQIDCVVVYKVDRLSRSLLDFARMMEIFDRRGISFVSVTQQFNTASSMGRLILNVLLSFAQFEREMISERTRDKIAATRRKGKWSGGVPLLGYDVVDRKLVINAPEAARVQQIFSLYIERRSLLAVAQELEQRGWASKVRTTRAGAQRGGRAFTKNTLHQLLTNVTYKGQTRHKDEVFAGEHPAIVTAEEFDKVQSILHSNLANKSARGGEHPAPLLRGLLRCAACDCAMINSYTVRGTRRYRYYLCTNAQRRGWTNCPSPSVPAAEIERFITDEIQALASEPAATPMGSVLRQFALDWPTASPADQGSFLTQIVDEVAYNGRDGKVAIKLRQVDEVTAP